MNTNMDNKIQEPIIPLVDKLKYKLGYFQGRSKVVTTVVGVTLMAGISMFVAYASLNRNVSLNPDSFTGAANPSCYLVLTRPTPTPSPTPVITPSPTVKPTVKPTASPTVKPTIKPTASPIAGKCSITFIPSTHQSVCWTTARPFTVTYKVNSLPTNGVYYMQTNWYVASPSVGPNHYLETQRIYAGQTYTYTAQWPGILSSKNVVDVQLGLNVVDANHNLITPNCSMGLDYYWTPFVKCP